MYIGMNIKYVLTSNSKQIQIGAGFVVFLIQTTNSTTFYE